MKKKPLYPAKPTRCQKCRRDLWKGRCENPQCSEYRNGDRIRFKAGSRVVVNGYPEAGVRVVKRIYTDIDGGRRLSEPVDGFVSWNVADLRRARRNER
jgi:hypothetical protein